MTLHQVVIMCGTCVVLCIIGVILSCLIFKWTLRSKFDMIIASLSAVLVCAISFFVYSGLSLLNFIIVAVVVFLSTLVAVNASISISKKPIKKISASLELLSKGDFTQKIDLKTGDEFEEVFQKINIMIVEISRLVNSIKKGSIQNFKMVGELTGFSKEMADKADDSSRRANTVASSSGQMSSNMKAVAASLKKAAENIEMVAAAVEETTNTINEIANNTNNARNGTDESVKQAINASKRIKELDTAARNISKVTETITEISEQTNLLALNATIEAARAGDSGKGFAVVAGEIKELARQTASATQEIKNMIDNIQSTTANAVLEIEKITTGINSGNEIVSAIASAVEEQTITTREIASNVSSASREIKEINQNVNQGLSSVESITKDIAMLNQDANVMSTSSSRVNISIETLSELAEMLRQEAGKFAVLDDTHHK